MSDTSTLFALLTDRLRRRLLVQLCVERTLRVPEDLQTRRAPVPGAPAEQRARGDSGPLLDRSGPPDSSRSEEELLIELRHVHLPKLESADVIDWDRDDDRVSRGPAFEQYEPALRTMIDAADEFPDSLV